MNQPGEGGSTVGEGTPEGREQEPDTIEGDVPAPSSRGSGPTFPSLGRYQLRRIMGHGGMGVVYDAWDPQLGREVAIKLLAGVGKLGPQGQRRFVREARAVARLSHPNIIDIYDFDHDQGMAWFVMPLHHGPTLAQRIRAAPLSPREVALLGASLARALHHAHAHGVVHRDVKPANILMRGEVPILSDFGAAKDLFDGSEPITVEAGAIGTPAYMAPEQRRGDRGAIGGAADQYALAITLVEAVTGARPGPPSVSADLVFDEVDPGGSLAGAGLPLGLALACGRALADAPGARYPSALDFAEDLERFARGEGVVATRTRLSERIGAQLDRRLTPRRLATGIAALMAGVALLWGAGALLDLARARARESRAAQRLAATESRMIELDAEGERAQADALFDAFAGVEAHQGTQALAAGWRAQAERLAARGEDDRALQALASSYASAATDRDLALALTGLANVFARMGRWDQLTVALDTLQLRTPALAVAPELEALAVRSRFASWRLGEGVEGAGDEPLTRVGAALARGIRTRLRYEPGLYAATDLADGRRGLLALHEDGGAHRLYDLGDPLLPLVSEGASPEVLGHPYRGSPLHRGPGQPADLLALHTGPREAALYRWDGEQVRCLEHWPSDPISSAATADLDGDGRSEVYFGTATWDRDLYVMTADDEGRWTRRAAHAPTTTTESEILGVAALGASKGGPPAIAVATGPWRAFDLRVLASDGGGGLRQVARRKLGALCGLAAIAGHPGRLLALKRHGAPSPSMFSSATPYGARTGAYLFDVMGSSIEAVAFQPFRAGWAPNGILQGDLDGDGQPEALLYRAVKDYDTADVLTGLSAGALASAPLTDIIPLAISDVDHDGDDELVAALGVDDGQIWILGAGEEVPPSTPALPTDDGAPPGISAEERELWQRAVDLSRLGLIEAALGQWRRVAALALEAQTARGAVEQAAQLLLADEKEVEAAELYEAAARGPGGGWATGPAVDLFMANNRLAQALDLARLHAEDLRSSGDADAPRWASRAGEIEARLGDLGAWQETFDVPLGPDWTVVKPQEMSWSRREGSLRVEAVSGAGGSVVASLPVQGGDGPFTLEAEIVIDRLEWGAGVAVELAEANGHGFSLDIDGAGGQGQLHHRICCGGSRYGWPCKWVPVPGPGTEAAYRLRLDVLQHGTMTCSVRDAATGEPLMRYRGEGRETGELVRLAVGNGDRQGQLPGHQVALAHVREIRLQGIEVRARPQPETPWDEAGRALSDADPARALALTREPMGGVPEEERLLLRFEAFEELGLAAEAAAAVGEAVRIGPWDDDAWRARLASLMRTHPIRVGAAVEASHGRDAWLALFIRAWETAAESQHGDALTRANLTLGLGEAARYASVPADLAPSLAKLLVARARSSLQSGQAGPARADLAQALALLDRSVDRSSAPLNGDIAAWSRSEVHRLLASLEVDQGDTDQAFAHLEAALADPRYQVITQDILWGMDELEPLHSDPRWERLMGGSVRGWEIDL